MNSKPGSKMQKSTSIGQLSQKLKDAAASGFMAKDVSDMLVEGLSDQTLAATTGAVDPENLDTESVTLIQFVIDASSSMIGHRDIVVEALKSIVKDLQGYKQSAEMLVGAWQFDSQSKLLFASKRIGDVKDDFDGYQPSGMTAMYDAVQDALVAGRAYAQDLIDEDYRVRMIVIALTDGEDNSSNVSSDKVRQLSAALMSEEIAVLAMVGFNGWDSLDSQTIADRVGFPNVLELDFTDDAAVHKSIKKMTGMISASVIKASQNAVAASQNSFFD